MKKVYFLICFIFFSFSTIFAQAITKNSKNSSDCCLKPPEGQIIDCCNEDFEGCYFSEEGMESINGYLRIIVNSNISFDPCSRILIYDYDISNNSNDETSESSICHLGPSGVDLTFKLTISGDSFNETFTFTDSAVRDLESGANQYRLFKDGEVFENIPDITTEFKIDLSSFNLVSGNYNVSLETFGIPIGCFAGACDDLAVYEVKTDLSPIDNASNLFEEDTDPNPEIHQNLVFIENFDQISLEGVVSNLTVETKSCVNQGVDHDILVNGFFDIDNYDYSWNDPSITGNNLFCFCGLENYSVTVTANNSTCGSETINFTAKGPCNNGNNGLIKNDQNFVIESINNHVISLNNPSQKYIVEASIYDLNGKLIQSSLLNNKAEQFELALESNLNGLFIVRLTYINHEKKLIEEVNKVFISNY